REDERASPAQQLAQSLARHLAHEFDVVAGARAKALRLGALPDEYEISPGQIAKCVDDDIDALVWHEARCGDVTTAVDRYVGGRREECAVDRRVNDVGVAPVEPRDAV